MKLSTTILSLIAASMAIAAPVESTEEAEVEVSDDLPYPKDAVQAIVPIGEDAAPVFAEYNGTPYVLIVNSTVLEGEEATTDKRDWTKYGYFEPHKREASPWTKYGYFEPHKREADAWTKYGYFEPHKREADAWTKYGYFEPHKREADAWTKYGYFEPH